MSDSWEELRAHIASGLEIDLADVDDEFVTKNVPDPEAARRRVCGPCRICCNLIAVKSLDKPAGKWCRHSCAEGCAIYQEPERPPECGTFLCAWRLGVGKEDDRPDRLKIVAFVLKDSALKREVLTLFSRYSSALRSGGAARLRNQALALGVAVAEIPGPNALRTLLIPDRKGRVGVYKQSEPAGEDELVRYDLVTTLEPAPRRPSVLDDSGGRRRR